MRVSVSTVVPPVPLTSRQARLWRQLLAKKADLAREWVNVLELASLGAVQLEKQPNGQLLIVPLKGGSS